MMFRLLLILCLGHCLPGADSQALFAEIGEPIMLPCDAPADTDTKEDLVLWKFNGKPACWDANGKWCEIHPHVNRTRLGSIQQNIFSLVIYSVMKEDEGVYVCVVKKFEMPNIRLIVGGDQKRRDAEMAGEVSQDPVCRPYREREDPGSETKDKQDFDENPPGAFSGGNSVVIVGIVGILVAVVAVVGAAVLIKRPWNRQGDENLPDPGPFLPVKSWRNHLCD